MIWDGLVDACAIVNGGLPIKQSARIGVKKVIHTATRVGSQRTECSWSALSVQIPLQFSRAVRGDMGSKTLGTSRLLNQMPHNLARV